MAALGTFLLLSAFVVCSYAAVISVVGARRASRRLIESGIGAFYLVAALTTVASAVIVNAFLTDDFSIRYVAHESETLQPLFYKITSFWGGLDGSIMFWVLLLSLFGSLAVFVNKERHRELIPYVVATISTVQMFFLYLMVVHKNPFTTFLTAAPADGTGLNPLLQNYWMAIHPPSLYTGFVGMTIPFAFGIAALITGHLDDSWLRAVRRWTMFSWLFLTFGLMLGMIWAYEVLGWGGYWGWDPVENAALLPWFTATAFLHSVMVQERRSMLRVWNVTLVILTFFLTIFGTFLTRSGVVQSVHAFGDDPQLARLFTGFMVVILTFSFGLVIYRLPLLRARAGELDSWVSREAAFLVNNWILLFCAFFVAFATMFPTLSEAVTGTRLTVGPPFFNRWMLPIGLILLFLTGLGPLLAWRKSTLTNLRDSFLWPTTALVVAVGVLAAVGLRQWAALTCFALSAFVTTTIGQEFWRGAKVRKKNTGTDLFTALVGLVGRNKRRYGGYIVHVGIVLIFLGFAGNAYKRDVTELLQRGQQMTVGAYTVRNDQVKIVEDGQKQTVFAYVSVFKGGKQIDTMYPGKSTFRKHEDEPPRTEVAIRRAVAEDLYLVMATVDPRTQAVGLNVVINPLVDWVWMGFGILAFGTGIALLPESTFSFALAKLPAEAATTAVSIVLALVLIGLPRPAFAQHMEAPAGTITAPRNALEQRLRSEIGCTCGGCAHEPLSKCTCGQAEQMRAEVREQVDLGKSHEEIINYFIANHEEAGGREIWGGQRFLTAPLDRGFNRLAWLFPYLLGMGGVVGLGFVAVKWSKHPAEGAPADAAPADAALNERLDDELRNLD
jgi:cytochrome c-type biogenesis protein CcmF